LIIVDVSAAAAAFFGTTVQNGLMDQGSDTHQERTRQVDELRRGSYQLPHIYDYLLSSVHRSETW